MSNKAKPNQPKEPSLTMATATKMQQASMSKHPAQPLMSSSFLVDILEPHPVLVFSLGFYFVQQEPTYLQGYADVG